FILALDTLSGLKGIGDMQNNQRTCLAALRTDLTRDHFDGKRRLSDGGLLVTEPPREGFFVVYQGAASTSEGNDADGVPSYYSQAHILHFTVKARGNREESFYTALIDPNGSTPAATLNAFYAVAKNFNNAFTTTGAVDPMLNKFVPGVGGPPY